MTDARFFRLTNWDKHQNFRGKRAHWMKLSLDFFDDPTIVKLPDSQRLAFIGVMVLCGKRSNCVPFDASYVRKRCSLRVTPDLELFMREGLIEFTQAVYGAEAFPRYVEESRGDKRRVEGTEEHSRPPTPASPSEAKAAALSVLGPPDPPRELTPDEAAEKAIRAQTGILERRLYTAVARLSERTGRDSMGLMRQVTAYKARDGTTVPGRSNPSGLTSERLEKSIADAEGWLADLEKQGATA